MAQAARLVGDERPEDWLRLIDVNLGGVYRCCRAAVRQMLKQAPVDEVRGLIDQGPMLPDAALSHGLVDDVAYFDEIGKTSGLGDRFTELPLEQYLTVMPANRTPLNAPVETAEADTIATELRGSRN